MRRTKKKTNDKDKELEDKFDIHPSYYRYKGIKGLYWSLFSEYVRRRDFYKYKTCVSCGKTFNTWKDSQAGHYAPAGNCGFGLLFDEDNVHAECPGCNNPVFSPGKLITYRMNLVARYGEKWVKKLDDRYKNAKNLSVKEWTKLEYEQEILKLKKKLKALIKKNESTE